MTYNYIRTFFDIAHHIELKDECLKTTRLSAYAYAIESSSMRFSDFKCRWYKSKKWKEIVQGPKNRNKQFKRKRGKRAYRRDKTKMTCYNYGNKSPFICECMKLKKVLSHSTLNYETFISSTVLLTDLIQYGL